MVFIDVFIDGLQNKLSVCVRVCVCDTVSAPLVLLLV